MEVANSLLFVFATFRISLTEASLSFFVSQFIVSSNQFEKLEKKSLVTFIYVGQPTLELQAKMGHETRIQLNDRFADVSEVQDYIYQERENMKEEDQPFMQVSLKVDKDTKMGIVTDIKQALRQSYALNINYSAAQKN